MSRSATSSDARVRGASVLTGALLLVALLMSAAPAAAQGVLTQEEALRLAFPGATLQRRTAYLDPAQLRAAQDLAGPGVPVAQRVVTYYVAMRDGRPQGAAYFDAHRVRTLGEVLLLAVDTQARLQRIEVLKFAEPPEYNAGERWLAQFEGAALAPELSLKRGIVNMTGATLTANAVTAAARRTLALHAVIRPFDAGR